MSDLGTAWSPAPAILAGAGLSLFLFAKAFLRLRRRGRADHTGWWRLVVFALAVSLATLPLVSPLDGIGDSDLLSAHMLQHVLIGDAAPALALVALRGPLFFFLATPALLRPLSRRHGLRQLVAFLLRPGVSLAAWALVLASWHVPAAYDFALRHETVHDLEHLSFMLVGVLVWMQIVDPARRGCLGASARLTYMLVLVGAGAVLAAVLVVAPAPLYPAYASSGRLLGITPVRDQQLAGIVMLAEQLAAFSICAAFLLRTRSLEPNRRARLSPAAVER